MAFSTIERNGLGYVTEALHVIRSRNSRDFAPRSESNESVSSGLGKKNVILAENTSHVRLAFGRRPGRWIYPPGDERDPREHARKESTIIRNWIEGLVALIAGYTFSTFVLDAISLVFSKAVLGFAGGFAAGRFVRSLFYSKDEFINGLITIGVGLVTALFIWTTFASALALSPFVLTSLMTYGAGAVAGYAASLFAK